MFCLDLSVLARLREDRDKCYLNQKWLLRISKMEKLQMIANILLQTPIFSMSALSYWNLQEYSSTSRGAPWQWCSCWCNMRKYIIHARNQKLERWRKYNGIWISRSKNVLTIVLGLFLWCSWKRICCCELLNKIFVNISNWRWQLLWGKPRKLFSVE